METIRIPFNQLQQEPRSEHLLRYSDLIFKAKVPKGLTPCDCSIQEQLVEFEKENGDRIWADAKSLFGKVIFEAKDIFILYEGGKEEKIVIADIAFFKIKRTNYLKLIFETTDPF